MVSRSDTLNSRILIFSGLAFFFLVLIGPVITNMDGQNGTESGSLLRQVGYILTFGLLVFAVWREGHGTWALRMPLPIVIALAWCWLSLAWAINIEIALQRVVLTTISVWFAFILVRGGGYQRSLEVLRAVLVLALVVNYLIVWLYPQFGMHLSQDTTTLYGSWRGMMGHKNFAGAVAAITILLFVFSPGTFRPAVRFVIIAASTYFLYNTQSKTSGGMVVMALIAGWVFLRFDWSIRRFAIPLLMVLSAAMLFIDSIFFSASYDQILSPRAFTGRGLIWSTLLRYAQDNWLLGTGFGSFWNVGFESPVYTYGTGFVRDISVGHNGYLDLLVTIGAPGLALALIATVIVPTMKLLASTMPARRGALTVALLVFCVGHNCTESSLFERDSFVGVIMMIAVAYAQSWYARDEQKGPSTGGQDVFAALRKRTKTVTHI
ncbi:MULTISPECIES: O-antigen ligase [unclassified Novosphingobium]|uniref:O-antigen ligase family protein n=1 Tax=unclassified Novosphingobium TaxID=2644732 RepID=UPI00145B9F04|nr:MULTISPECIES: O-antigen ligase family protein [unclassified Novosphingobium]MBB3360021.1 O-antigen ligase [Novosphingobium sp. BK256]MBB3376380.1 O-antigen ligase [Novosphingobium sp. BK280]MBB3380739.1 O-antigen ligase [Novosphingobium sp. BK258]MBB3422445.1 O-antigen ligase [Novosphingobium sp. BK267]MBB3451090.1 O-antigen ligase [Novosphingobium sp. BK352]